MAEMTHFAPAMDSEFVAEFARRLQKHSHEMALPLLWLEERLGERHVTIEQLMQSEGQQLAADQVSIGNSVGSLRYLAAVDWHTFVESLSFVEHILRGYPPEEFGYTDDGEREYRRIMQDLQGYADVYEEMDFATRDRYRHAVERIARQSGGVPEWQVAMQAVRLTLQAANAKGIRDRAAHVGYFLIDHGLPELEAATHAPIPPWRRLLRFVQRFPLPLYLGAIGGIALALAMVALSYALRSDAGPALAIITALLALLGSTHLSVAVVNWAITLFASPKPLPRMDFTDGIPPDCRTMIAIPTLLTSAAGVSDLVEAFEVRYLANRDEQLHFALLSDLRDAATETTLEDEALVAQGGPKSRRSTKSTARIAATSSSSSIARASGTPRSACGWDTSASEESCRT